MRPAPPEPDTPNDGRKRAYSPLVEPYEPEKLQRREMALIGVAGGVAGGLLIGLAQVIFTVLL